MSESHLLVIVHAHVLPEAVESFRTATLANAAASVREPGVVRFDVAQEAADPNRFVLIEVYRGPEGAAAHKQTAHYQTWRDAVAPMMAEPRTSVKFANIYPSDAEWK
jgi:(4S)-4-hydroxy-5-phosphonooxypentane-2,3-dione isomerase